MYEVVILDAALEDVQEAVDFYENRSKGLGEQMEAELNDFLLTLETIPFFQNRYDDVRCIPLRRFPFMVHFSVDHERFEVIVHAVFHTSLNPEGWKRRAE